MANSIRMAATEGVYDYVTALAPIKTPHDLSYQVTGTGDMGVVYPHYHQLLYPGDKVELSADAVIRQNPQLAPVMHEIRGKILWAFVPIRLLWSGDAFYNLWELFITGAVNGKELSKYNKEHPNKQIAAADINDCKWWPNALIKPDGTQAANPNNTAIGAEIGTVWEALGLPYAKQITGITVNPTNADNMPVDWAKRAYNKLYNDWLRNENLQDERDLRCDTLYRINWPRDYLTSAAYEQQKGTRPELQLNVTLPRSIPLFAYEQPWNSNKAPTPARYLGARKAGTGVGATYTPIASTTTDTNPTGDNYYLGMDGLASTGKASLNVSDLRLLIAVQRALELDMRGGTRYTEYLNANFATSPRDERLQLTELIGQENFVIQNQVVIQTGAGESGSPQGNMAGYSEGGVRGQKKKYYATEHGIVIGVFWVAPKPQYQQKIPRDMIVNDKAEIYRPQFAYLSEQEIYNAEVYFTGDTQDDMKIFGYQGRWDHLRMRENIVTGLMRADAPQNLSFWNMARYFGNAPALNEGFIECTPRKDYLAVPSEPAMIYTIGWRCHAMRPIPATSEPGLLDHVYGDQYGPHAGRNSVPRLGRHITT